MEIKVLTKADIHFRAGLVLGAVTTVTSVTLLLLGKTELSATVGSLGAGFTGNQFAQKSNESQKEQNNLNNVR